MKKKLLYIKNINEMSMNTAKRICSEMISQRGYELISEEENIWLNNNTGNKLIVFVDENKLNKDVLGKYIYSMNKHDINDSIIIYSNGVTTMTIKYIEKCIDLNIQLFSSNELQINITKHNLQPISFINMGKDNSIEFIKKYGCNFPIMLYSDPIRKFYDFERGSVIEITNKRGIVYHRIIK